MCDTIQFQPSTVIYVYMYLVKEILIKNAIFRKFTASRFPVRGSPALTTEDGLFELINQALILEVHCMELQVWSSRVSILATEYVRGPLY